MIRLDGRGSARRGLRFEGAVRHNMGDLELQDQVAPSDLNQKDLNQTDLNQTGSGGSVAARAGVE